MSATLNLACDLINLASVTPEDAGCQQLLADRMEVHVVFSFLGGMCFLGTEFGLYESSPLQGVIHIVVPGHVADVATRAVLAAEVVFR